MRGILLVPVAKVPEKLIKIILIVFVSTTNVHDEDF